MAYQDLTVTFQPIPDSERYRVITHSPTDGQAVANFVSPFGDERINTWRDGVDPDEMHMIGTLLYRRLFSPDICQAFQSAQRFAERQGLALRLKLALDGGLAQLPWEYLYNPDSNQFLCLDGRLALVRHIAIPNARKLLKFDRVPGVYLSDTENANANAPSNTFASGTAQTRAVEPSTVEAGMQLEDDFQILHLRAPGGRDPASGEYALRVPNGVGERWLTVGQVARWLNANPSVQLVVIDSCFGSDSTAREASAMAAELVTRQRVPAAVALQFPLPLLLRESFFKTFYRALSNEAGLDLAVTEGRQAIAAMDGTWEWGAPVLYSALRDDQPRPRAEKFEMELVHTQNTSRHEK
jgi:hypothetical protein